VRVEAVFRIDTMTGETWEYLNTFDNGKVTSGWTAIKELGAPPRQRENKPIQKKNPARGQGAK
jgi:hypothetical protein